MGDFRELKQHEWGGVLATAHWDRPTKQQVD